MEVHKNGPFGHTLRHLGLRLDSATAGSDLCKLTFLNSKFLGVYGVNFYQRFRAPFRDTLRQTKHRPGVRLIKDPTDCHDKRIRGIANLRRRNKIDSME